VAGLLLSLDGLHLVLSRLALLDIFVALFLLCGVSCLVNDRAWHRARMSRLLPAGRVAPGSWGPVRGLLLRPWLLAGGVSFGLALGTKWEVAYPLAAFGLLVWVWSAGARRSFGVRGALLRSAVVDGVPAFLQLVVVALLVYLASWTGWLLHAHEYETHLSATQYTHADGGRDWPTRTEPDAQGLGELTQSLRSLASYHRDVYVFHTQFLNGATHTYASNPAGWLLLNRPVGVAADTDIQPGRQGCDAPRGSTCLRQVLLLGNPVIWWGGVVALLFAAAMWLGARDWRYGLTLVGTASTWLPWLMYDNRPIFSFYAIVTLPFLVLATTLALGRVVGPSVVPGPRRTVGVVAAGSYVVLALVAFAWFWPVWTDGLLTHREWLDRIWFSRWI
jgi:dolichyl-phosphate-mannose--protein O-mannosyl transferase